MELKELSLAVEKGKMKQVKELVNQALAEGIPVEDILNQGLISAMEIVGDKFRENKIFVPEMLVASRAMSAGLKILEPLMSQSNFEPIGKVVIGTVKGDLHDIGKNLVAMMLKGVGATVYDVGVDADESVFLKKAEEVGADIICLSALLTTTMPAIKDVIDAFTKEGTRDKYYIMISGAPVSQQFADQIGADAYTSNAPDAATVAKKYLEGQK